MKFKTKRFPVVGTLPLRLAFCPDAIREHFDAERVETMSDRQLSAIGAAALSDDELYTVFNAALRRAFIALASFDPDED
jgi:hypothetical protein